MIGCRAEEDLVLDLTGLGQVVGGQRTMNPTTGGGSTAVLQVTAAEAGPWLYHCNPPPPAGVHRTAGVRRGAGPGAALLGGPGALPVQHGRHARLGGRGQGLPALRCTDLFVEINIY